MVRHAHLLKTTKSDKIPTKWIIFDCESTSRQITPDKIEHSFEVGYAEDLVLDSTRGLSVKNEIVYTDPGDLVKTVLAAASDRPTTWLMGYNVVYLVTICDFFQRLHDAGWTLAGFYSRELTSIFRWERGDQRIKLLDIGNFFSGDLSEWATRLQIQKTYVFNDAVSYGKKLESCIRDVNIIKQLLYRWTNFLTANKLGRFKPTVSSTAFNAFRHKYLKARVHIHNNPDAIELERDAYQGGRTECLYIGSLNDGPYNYLDINNLYGHVLANNPYPVSLWNYRPESNLYRLRYKLDRYAVIAEVDLELPVNPYPVKLWYHTCYPVGSYRTVLTTPELILAYDNGWIRDVHRIAWYRKAPLFRDYANDMRAIRERYQNLGARGMEKIVKLMINGFYGKFGQRDLTQKKIGDCDPSIYRREQVYDLEDQYYYDQVYLGGSIFMERQAGESYHSFPAIAAHVTAYARLYLYYLMSKVPRGHLYYVDTDSLIVSQTGYNALNTFIDPDTMGMLKVELKSPWLVINGPKYYSMEGRARIAGIKKSANPLGDRTYQVWEWPKLRGLLQRGMSGEYTINHVVKHFDGKIWTARLSPSGWLEPFLLANGSLIDSVPLYQPPGPRL